MATLSLLTPQRSGLLLIDQQAGLASGLGSTDRQILVNNVMALTKTAIAFGLPIVISTSASRAYGGPLLPEVQALAPDVEIIERQSMNLWEDLAGHAAVEAMDRGALLVAGLLTEACVTFPVLAGLASNRDMFVVADACAGVTPASHELALRRMEQAGAVMTCWIQVLLELQRDWTRDDTRERVLAILQAHGGRSGPDWAAWRGAGSSL